MSATAQARSLFPASRRTAAKWVLARRYLASRNLTPYRGLSIAARIVQPRAA